MKFVKCNTYLEMYKSMLRHERSLEDRMEVVANGMYQRLLTICDPSVALRNDCRESKDESRRISAS